MTDRSCWWRIVIFFLRNRQNVATHLGKVMKTIHDTGNNCLYDKRVVAWLDDRKIFRNFPVAFWNRRWLYFLLHAITERWNKFVLSWSDRKGPVSTNTFHKFRPDIIPKCGEDLFFFFLVFTQLRGRNHIISTKVLSHAKCVWSRLQKRPPHAKFYSFKYWL